MYQVTFHSWCQTQFCDGEFCVSCLFRFCNLNILLGYAPELAVVSAVFCERKSTQHLFPSSVPVVMTTPARTFRRAWGEVKLSVSSLNLSTTRRETASARTWNHTHTRRNATRRHIHAATQIRACVRYVSLQSMSDVILP